MAQYEVEIKSLLGDKERADRLVEQLYQRDSRTALVGENKQLNHYFEGGDVALLADAVRGLCSEEGRKTLDIMVERGTHVSVRTRQKDDTVLLVMKASVDDGSSSNTVSRLEYEERVPLSLAELDALVQSAGYTYQAKWSRDRKEYLCNDLMVCIDRNAGYGYLAEFEKVTTDAERLPEVRKEIEAFMQSLEVHELPQARLERMFAHYNAHWPEYYGTEKVFVIE